MQTILVTGGAGFIGSHTCHLLRAAGYKVIVFDNLSNGTAKAAMGFEFIRGDLREPESILTAFTRHRFDAVVHFAASIEAGLSVANPLDFYDNNLSGTLNLLRAMAQHGVRKLVFSSTAAVFGNPARVPIQETDAKHPTNPYGRSKLAAEGLISDMVHTGMLDAVMLRYFNAAGAHPDGLIGEDHEPETHLIPVVLQAAAGRLPYVRIFGTDYPTPDGTCIRDYVHVMDLAHAHILALGYLGGFSGLQDFNLGTASGYSVKQVVDAVEAVTGRHIERLLSPRRAGDPAVLVAGNAKAMELLHWRPQYPGLEIMIGHAWAYLAKQWQAKA